MHWLMERWLWESVAAERQTSGMNENHSAGSIIITLLELGWKTKSYDITIRKVMTLMSK